MVLPLTFQAYSFPLSVRLNTPSADASLVRQRHAECNYGWMLPLLLQSAEMGERFELGHIETCMGGQLKSPLFDLETYGQRMKVRVECWRHTLLVTHTSCFGV